MVIYKQGDIIWQCDPFVHVISEKQRLIRCNYCFKKSTSLRRCSKCKWTHYCSTQCQVKDWKNAHQMECKLNCGPIVESESWLLGDDYFQLVAKLVMISTKFPERFLEPIKTLKGETTLNQISTTGINSNPELEQMIRLLSLSFQMKLGGNDFQVNVSKIEDCLRLAMMKRSLITITDISPFGMGIYGGVSDFDYSCSPNCCQIFEGTKLQIKAIKEFDSEQNRPVLGYIDGRLTMEYVMLPSSREWFVKEKCISCDSYECFPTCNPQQLADWEKFVLEFQKGATLGSKTTRNPTGALDAGLKFLSHQGNFLPNPHPFRTAILSHLFQMASTLDDDRLKSIAKELYRNFMIIYGKNHSVYKEYPHIMLTLAALNELP